MSSDSRRRLDRADAELDEAQCALVTALESAYDDDNAMDRINAVLRRLRVAQAHRTAARTGLAHLTELIGGG